MSPQLTETFQNRLRKMKHVVHIHHGFFARLDGLWK